MSKGQNKNTSNKIQGHMTPPEISGSTTASPGDINTQKAQVEELKSVVIKMIKAFKQENKSLNEIQENPFK